jgi:peptidoglycan/xylan/chitin deacetylase (PgdA/CDA1 family)
MVQGKVPVDGRYFHLSFDDGFRNVFLHGIPILRELEVPAIVFVPTTFIGADYDAVRRYCLRGYAGVVETLNWDDLRTLVSWGYEVGSHTRSHARFSELSTNGMLEAEICGSKSDIESHLDVECKYISWPYGTKRDADTTSLGMTRQAGYRACFGAFRGSVVPNQTSVFSVPRHHFEVQWPLSHIRYFAAGNMEA